MLEEKIVLDGRKSLIFHKSPFQKSPFPQKYLLQKDSLFEKARLYAAALVLASTSLSLGCGTNEKEEECSTNTDCLHQCIDYVLNADCNYTNPMPGQVEQCQEQGTERCQEKYSSGRLYCGRSCGERTVPDCNNNNNNVTGDDLYCERKRTEAYCENACMQD